MSLLHRDVLGHQPYSGKLTNTLSGCLYYNYYTYAVQSYSYSIITSLLWQTDKHSQWLPILQLLYLCRTILYSIITPPCTLTQYICGSERMYRPYFRHFLATDWRYQVFQESVIYSGQSLCRDLALYIKAIGQQCRCACHSGKNVV